MSCCEASLPGSQLATLENNNDRTGVTEKHAYRRQFDDRIDLTFYVDAENYTAIRFFEGWISYIMNEDQDDNPISADGGPNQDQPPNLASKITKYQTKNQQNTSILHHFTTIPSLHSKYNTNTS